MSETQFKGGYLALWKLFLIIFFLFTYQSVFAVVGGKKLWIPNGGEEQIIRQATVRLVKVGKDLREFQFCSGVIFQGLVLTAGHCFTDDLNMHGELIAGQLFAEIYDPQRPSQMKRIRISSGYYASEGPGGKLDIALVKLDSVLPMPFSIPIAYSGCDKDSTFVAAGFGLDENERHESIHPNIAQYSPMGLDELTALKKNGVEGYLESQQIYESDSRLFFKSNRGKICMGDSGGPIFCKSNGKLAISAVNGWIQIGAISVSASIFEKLENGSEVEKCSSRYVLRGNSVSKSMDLIEKWLERIDADSKSDAATNNSNSNVL